MIVIRVTRCIMQRNRCSTPELALLVRQTPLCADCVQMPAVQARHAAPLLPATPAADILDVDAAYDKRPPLGLPCEPATRRLGSAAPTGCRAQLYFRLKHLGRLVQHSRLSTDKGSDIFSFSKKRSDEECSQTGLLLR